MKITEAWLIKLGASPLCSSIQKFRHEFPDGAEITEENILKAIESNMHIEWILPHILNEDTWYKSRHLLVDLTNRYGNFFWRKNAVYNQYKRDKANLIWTLWNRGGIK